MQFLITVIGSTGCPSLLLPRPVWNRILWVMVKLFNSAHLLVAAVYISNRLLALAEVGMRRRSEDVTWMHVTRVMLSMKYLPAST
jgi:hypothetical protein